MTSSSPRTAIITGANAGVGYAIALRLAIECPQDITIVLACRNPARAEEAQRSLRLEYEHHLAKKSKKKEDENQALQQHKVVEFVVELVDVGRARSVLAFNARIQQRFRQIDYLFCNAGVLPSDGIRWGKLVKEVFTDPLNLVIRSDVLLQPKQSLTEDGLGNVFACNVFGHYLMVKGLEDQLDKTAEDPGRVIWTGSKTAEKASHNADDFQGLESTTPYEASKWATDLLAIRLNAEWAGNSSSSNNSNHHHNSNSDEKTLEEPRRLTRSQTRSGASLSSSTLSSRNGSTASLIAPKRRRWIRSIATDPGVVASSMGNFALWLVWFRIMVHYFVRIVFAEGSQTITAYHGAMANVAVALQQGSEETATDARTKFGSRVSPMGHEYMEIVSPVEDYEDADGQLFVEQLEQLRQKVLAQATTTITAPLK